MKFVMYTGGMYVAASLVQENRLSDTFIPPPPPYAECYLMLSQAGVLTPRVFGPWIIVSVI